MCYSCDRLIFIVWYFVIVQHNPYLLKEKETVMKIVGGCGLFLILFLFLLKKHNRCERMSTTEKGAGETKYKEGYSI